MALVIPDTLDLFGFDVSGGDSSPTFSDLTYLVCKSDWKSRLNKVSQKRHVEYVCAKRRRLVIGNQPRTENTFTQVVKRATNDWSKLRISVRARLMTGC